MFYLCAYIFGTCSSLMWSTLFKCESQFSLVSDKQEKLEHCVTSLSLILLSAALKSLIKKKKKGKD